MTKLSRKQREEKAFMRRAVLIGAGAVGLASLAARFIISGPADFPELQGADTISDRLAQLGSVSHHQQLAGQPSSIDVLVIGDSSCGFCREFVENGLENLVDFARNNDLSLGYAAIGITPQGAATTAAAACLERIPSDLTPVGRVRAIYALSERLTQENREAATVISEAAADLGVTRRQIEACLAREGGILTTRNGAMKAQFEVTGTPTFIVRTKDGERLAKFQGYSGSASVIRQVEAALAS